MARFMNMKVSSFTSRCCLSNSDAHFPQKEEGGGWVLCSDRQLDPKLFFAPICDAILGCPFLSLFFVSFSFFVSSIILSACLASFVNILCWSNSFFFSIQPNCSEYVCFLLSLCIFYFYHLSLSTGLMLSSKFSLPYTPLMILLSNDASRFQ